MKTCDTCTFSRTQPNALVMCHVAPPPAPSANVTRRPAVCAKYQRESPVEQFQDMLPELERLIPKTWKRENHKTEALFMDATAVRHHIAFDAFTLYKSRGYPISQAMDEHIFWHKELWPEYKTPGYEAVSHG